MTSQSVEEYIEAIYRIGGESGTVNTCELAEHLGVAPASVTTMLGRLSRDGLVKHTPYHGITLTGTGRELAASIIRRHRLAERLLTDILGMPWERVHEAACRLEHVIDGEIEELAYKALGEPERCPHGHLLEGCEDTVLLPLSDAPIGKRVQVVKVTDESEECLRSAADVGLVPFMEVTVQSKSDERISVYVKNKSRTIPLALADCVWIHKLDKET